MKRRINRICSLAVPLMLAHVALPVSGTAGQAAQSGSPNTAAAGQTSDNLDPGLYITFETSMGGIRCRLFENEAPITVRTIVSLATGKKSYVDPATKQKVSGKNFYDGLTFHRVIPRFMIQGGDPLGTGEGDPEGPGFPFKDEFVPSLRFDIPGRLAMANAGPDSNGGQFFITEVPTPFLNDRHTIFGQCGNLDTVKAIARVPAEADRPLKPVVIKHVTVQRVGLAPMGAPEATPANPAPKPANPPGHP
jgi:peptidyl-prolyl cis-trans isomerase A (cyclophilin A)